MKVIRIERKLVTATHPKTGNKITQEVDVKIISPAGPK